MITAAKRDYVDSRHPRKISCMAHASGPRNGYWKTRIYVNGKRKDVVRSTKDALYEFLYEYYRSLEEAPKTFAEAVDLLLYRKEFQLNRSHNTVLDNRRYFEYISEEIRNMPLCDITEEDLRTWLVSEYLPRKPKEAALRKMLQLLKELFRFGQSKKLCVDNPAEYLLFDDYAKDCDLSRRRAEQRAFSEAEIAVLKADAMGHTSEPYALMTLLAAETGMRCGELAALRTCDIHDGFIHVHRQQLLDKTVKPHRFYDVDYTKDERKHPHGGRYVPITTECAEVLRLAESLPGSSDRLFHAKDGSPITTDGYIQNLRNRCSRLGIETHHNHAFRVAFNRKLHEMGFSPSDRALILGHSVETNERHYSFTDSRRLNTIRDQMLLREMNASV